MDYCNNSHNADLVWGNHFHHCHNLGHIEFLHHISSNLSRFIINLLICSIVRDDQELGKAKMTLLSQLSLWERDTDGEDADDGIVKTKVCNQTELQQTLRILNQKLYKRKFYKR